jgi:hypothetical protein
MRYSDAVFGFLDVVVRAMDVWGIRDCVMQ